MKSGVYLIRHVPTDRKYVGSSQDVAFRGKLHFQLLANGTHLNRFLQAAWNRHSPTEFTFEVLCYCPLKSLLKKEQFYIDKLCTIGKDFNLTPVAGNPRGYKHTPDAKAKMKNSWTSERRRNRSAAMLGNTFRKGIRWTETEKQLLSERAKLAPYHRKEN